MHQIPLCLSSWSLHSEFFNGELKPEDFPAVARQCFGVRKIEFFEGDFAADFLNDDVETIARAVAAACTKHDVEVVAISAINDVASAHDPISIEGDLRRIHKWLQLAPILNYSFLRINSGNVRLNSDSSAQLVVSLKALVAEATKNNVRLILENHPHLLGRDNIEQFCQVVEEVNHPSIGVCLDVGAFTPGFWREGFSRLVPFAHHIHLKPDVAESDEVELSISEYLPVLLEELKCRPEAFNGAATLEYTEFQLPGGKHRDEIRRLLVETATVAGMGQFLPSETEVAPKHPAPHIFRDAEYSPDSSLLQMLADGCQTQLHSNVTIHDFASGQSVHSSMCCHSVARVESTNPLASEMESNELSFCQLVENCESGKKICSEFHDAQLQLVEDGSVDQSRVTPCPMGLMTLTVPIRRDNRVFGAITCGPWIESGTEGMMTAAISKMPNEVQSSLEYSSVRLSPFSTGFLKQSRATLGKLARNLSELYAERFATLINLREGSDLIDRLRETVNTLGKNDDIESADPSAVAENLYWSIREFTLLLRVGGIVAYQLDVSRTGLPPRLVRIVTSDPLAPDQFPQSIKIVESENALSTPHLRSHVLEHFKTIGFQAITPTLLSSRLIVVYAWDRESRLTQLDEILVRQFVAELEHSTDHMLNLAVAREGESGLRFFIARLKHAVAGSLQAVDTEVRKLRKLIGEKYDAMENSPFAGLPLIHDRLRDASNNSGAILKHLVGQLRLLGEEGLRPRLRKTKVSIREVLKTSFRNYQRAGDGRGITLRLTEGKEDVTIVADASSMAELIENVTQNALKYARSGSYLRGSVDRSDSILESSDRPKWRLSCPGVRVEISNVGPSIPEEDAERIYKSFTQGDNTPPGDAANSGTGIGLAICDQIVNDHGGKIFHTQRPIPMNPNGDFNVNFFMDIPF